MAVCSHVSVFGLRCKSRCRFGDRCKPLGQRWCSEHVPHLQGLSAELDANRVVEDRNDAAYKPKSSRKTGGITFHETHFCLFSDVLTLAKKYTMSD